MAGLRFGILLVAVATTGLACTMFQPGPDAVVLAAFDAYTKTDSAKVADLMSDEGKRNADKKCSGSAVNCLNIDYGSLGKLQSRSATVMSKGETAAEVVLRTTWHRAHRSAVQATPVCQVYQLDHTDKGWQIRFFEEARSCS